LNENIRKGLLHRAFSIFLFNEEGKLLLQQRSKEKITFPLDWTNTCCSHPLFRDDEIEEKDEIGVKRAAQRKLEHELGIPAEDVPLSAFKCVSRIHYIAESNGIWGEHEIDYILIIQRNVRVTPNYNEVENYQYVSQEELTKFTLDPNVSLTPWFRLIAVNSLLTQWWNALDHVEDLKDLTIRKFI